MKICNAGKKNESFNICHYNYMLTSHVHLFLQDFEPRLMIPQQNFFWFQEIFEIPGNSTAQCFSLSHAIWYEADEMMCGTNHFTSYSYVYFWEVWSFKFIFVPEKF